MLFEKLVEEKNLAQSTKSVYKSALSIYEKINNMTLDELIKEADAEEEQGLRWKNRKIKERLIQYRNYLYAHKSEGTVKRYLTIIKTIYKHFEIELHDLPSFTSKQIDKTYKMKYSDLLTREELIDGYYEANNLVKCILVFGISSGLSKVDMLNLTVGDFLEACSEYTTTRSILDQLLELKEQSDVIPCFEGNRQKTDSTFITFCSPEATEHIVQLLLGRDAHLKAEYQQLLEDVKEHPELQNEIDVHPQELRLDQKIFNITPNWVTSVFARINTKLNLGKVGKFGKFRCHQLRKFHASTLLNSEIMTWTVEEIDTLQGRSMDATHQAYFKNSREKLFKKYYECVDELMLFKSIHEIDKEKYDQLAEENRVYKNELEEQKKTIDEIKKTQSELEQMLLKVKI